MWLQQSCGLSKSPVLSRPYVIATGYSHCSGPGSTPGSISFNSSEFDEYVPYWIAGDDAYGCTEKLSHPSRMISSDTFNFYHSGCNRIYIECAFGYSTMGNSMEILGDVFRELNNAMIKWSVCFFTTFVRDVAFLKMLWVYLQKKLMLLDSPPVVHLQSLYESGRRRPEINRRSWALQLVVACLLLDNSINKNTTT